ncbi:MAG: 16S rRNA (cytosine(1402)-N(4))-methyltransferase RsmH [Clostridia bacterium]
MDFSHIPVLFDETIESLNIKPDGLYIDGTAGGAGHSFAIAKRISNGSLLCIDQDPDAIAVCTERLKGFDFVKIVRNNFSNIKTVANENEIFEVDGVLLDIGVSSFQLDCGERGFSFHTDAPLDMRMSKEGTSAKDLVNSLSWQELAKIFSQYGEEKYAVSIAKSIVKKREEKEIETTAELADIVRNSVPFSVRRKEGHPARKTFQALRIEVNGELDRLKEGLQGAFDLLKTGGRLSVITFHSLEDRIVKEQMRKWCESCTCPKDFPICICGNKAKGKLIYKKGLVPSEKELEQNPRARSSRLRVIEKL